MLKKKSDKKSHLLPTNKPPMPTCLYANMHVSTSRAYMLPTSTDDVFVPNVKCCIKSSQSSVTVPSVLPVCLTTSAGPILESKYMRVIFQKKDKKGQNI